MCAHCEPAIRIENNWWKLNKCVLIAVNNWAHTAHAVDGVQYAKNHSFDANVFLSPIFVLIYKFALICPTYCCLSMCLEREKRERAMEMKLVY